MRLAVAFDSTYGNTRRIAGAISSGWPEEPHDPPMPIRDLDARRLGPETLLVVGAPTHRHGVDPATWVALGRIPAERFRALRVAVFDTRYDRSRWLTGSAALEIERALVARGARAIVPAESFSSRDPRVRSRTVSSSGPDGGGRGSTSAPRSRSPPSGVVVPRPARAARRTYDGRKWEISQRFPSGSSKKANRWPEDRVVGGVTKCTPFERRLS